MAVSPVRRRHPLDAIGDRSHREAALALAATWLAFMTGLLVGGELEDGGSVAVAGVSGAVLVFTGFAAAARSRTLLPPVAAHRLRFGLVAVAAGTVLGVANLAANYAIAEMDPAIRAALVERMTALEPLNGLIASPLVEEIAVRLFLMSAIAWLVFRVTNRRTLAFAIGLVGSAFVFALLHLDRPLPGDPAVAKAYRGALLAKYTLAGLPLGWIFWRWGLPYSILCHVAANAAHLALQGRVF